MPTHFGINLREGKHGLKLTRDNYALVSKKSSLFYPPNQYCKELYEAKRNSIVITDEWCEVHLKNCMENYDLSMQFFATLNHTDFCNHIAKFIKRNKGFKQVTNLKEYDGVAGYYMMVLDEYCQLYVGISEDIHKRIRQHWNRRLPFDRMLFGNAGTSVIPIDCFRSLDTSRIYAYPTTWPSYSQEAAYIDSFPIEYVCNRVTGKTKFGGTKSLHDLKAQKP